jgi:hypothetical protein
MASNEVVELIVGGSCDDCPFYHIVYPDSQECGVNRQEIDGREMVDGTPTWCPLKEYVHIEVKMKSNDE